MSISHDFLTSILDYDPESGLFFWKNLEGNKKRLNGKVAGAKHIQGYWMLQIKEQRFLAHRLAWFYVHKEWPAKNIDHIDRNKLNNKITNLRLGDQSQNSANQKIKKNNQSGIKGVSYRRDIKKWRARIMVNRKEITLGVFETSEDASLAYRQAASKYFGAFAFSGVEDA
jgi:hypothetical protein